MRLFLIPIAALALASCGESVQSVSAAVTVSADQAYIAYVQRLTSQVQAGTISRDDFHARETTAYASLLLVRTGQITATAFSSSLK